MKNNQLRDDDDDDDKHGEEMEAWEAVKKGGARKPVRLD